LGPAIPINYSAVAGKGTGLINDDGGSEDDAHQIITYNASSTTAIVEAGDFEALPGVLDLSNQFVEGVELTFKSVITDLAGNQTTTEIYGTIITVDQTPPADGSLTPNDTDDDMITESVVTNAPFPDINVVSGFWNSHNTGLRLTAPLPAGDPSLVGGAVLILGKKSGNDTYDQLGYTITTVDAVTGEHSSNDLYDVSFNITRGEYDSGDPKTVPLPDGFLEKHVNGDYLFVENITDYADGENLSFAARVFDVAGNYTDWAESATRLKVDLTAPTITEVTSLNDNLAYNERDGIDNDADGEIDEDGEADEDQLIYISVVASEYMRNVGTGLDNSSLELNAGGSSNLAVFRGIGQQLVPNKDTLYYTYTIGADESSEDVDFPDGEWLLPNILVNHPTDNLNYVSISSLVINPNTGGLTDLAGNDLNRDLPPVGDDNALAQKKNIVIDTYAPKVTYTYFEETADGASSTVTGSEKVVSFNNEYLIIRARFNDSIQVGIKPTLAIDFPPEGGIVELPAAEMSRTLAGELPAGTDPYPAATSNFEYDYRLDLIDNVDGNITITPTAYDKANNLIDPVTGSDVVEIDNTEPVFTGLSPASNGFVNTSVVSYTLSEDVFSGSITWTGISGEDNGVIHEIELTDTELDAVDDQDRPIVNIDLPLTNDLDDLVDGSLYDISWSALDMADNPSPENISTSVLYDVTRPIVYLDYKLDVVSSGYEDTIC
jgi:hypothetical protein